MREELEAGLKNAIERGSSLEEAVQSFINAGYNPVEVKEAANNLNGITNIVNSNPINAKIQSNNSRPISNVFGNNPNSQVQKPVNLPVNNLQSLPKDNGKSKVKMVIIILVIFLVLLLGAMAVLLIFRESILNLLKPSQLLLQLYGN